MDQQSFTSKARAFVAIDALEQDLRRCILEYLLDHLDQDQVFGAEAAGLRSRRDSDPDGESGLLTDYLFLRQAYDTLLRHKQIIPRDLGDLLTLNVGPMDGFVAVRNRVMHGRPLRFDDLDSAHTFIARLRSRYFPTTEAILKSLERDPAWQPAFETKPAPFDRVLHNLPSADFDETGLVGRSVEGRQITDLLVKGRDRMITLTGEGGIGKTALALDACYSLVDSTDPPFEAVLWVSLKNERLTADGVRGISDAIRDISGAAGELGRSLDPSFGGSLEELADYLSGLRALVVIDNLESAQGDEVVALYDALPESVSFLFTSRVGIGQIERRIAIAGLSERDSLLLLRKFASRRGQSSIASLTDPVGRDVVQRLRHSPLAIRWYVLSVEAGKTPTDALRNQTELLRFCVDNVYEALSADAKLVLAILRTLDRPISFDELAVVAALNIDTLRMAAQVLAQGSLVVRTPALEVGAPDLLELSATARAYLPRVDANSSVMSGVLDREAAFVRDREEARLNAAKRVFDPNVVIARSDEDEPTAHLLRLALRLARNADFDGAEAQLSRARMLNPGYFEVDRVEAFILSNRGNSPVASARYRDARSQCVTDEERARVSYFLAGHLARAGHDLGGALPHAEFAYATLPTADTAMALGNYYVWDRRYSLGQELLESALEETGSHKLRRIITTAIVDSWRRWAEAELDDKMPESALEKGLSGTHTGKLLLVESAHDFRLADAVVRSIVVSVRAIKSMNDPSDSQRLRVGSELQFAMNDQRLRTVDSWERLVRVVAQLPDDFLLHQKRFLITAGSPRAERDQIVGLEWSGEQVSEARRFSGAILSVRERYAFISHPDFPENLFFHFGALAHPDDRGALMEGLAVEFDVSQDAEGRYRAENVVVVR
ncbi:NB-ARC domain-containing protein [Plantibacter sp. CFBP 13570]|uniref:NB-ARC domain-containing protein n=1 Tax=Plantibacter sp. CFBP 13570 TaxID=2775272 RepID=UPI001930E107|nr:NB-ARC domain-containing protein [Plantibacter sp. CFBP 13570]MBD8535215.1 cold shock domain-containing protein [Plantibacter sp. CFBP 13570]